MTISARRFAVGAREAEAVDLEDGARVNLDDKQVLWIDVGVEEAELARVDSALGLDGVVSSAMDTLRLGVRFGDEIIRLTVAGLEAETQTGRPAPVLIHFVAIPNAVVSVHEKAVLGLGDPLEAMAGDPRFGQLNAGMFLGLLLDGILNGFYNELENVERSLDQIDERALSRETPEDLVTDLVSARHRVAILRRSLAPQREVYASLLRPTEDDSNSPIGAPWPELITKLERVLEAVDSTRDSVLGSFDIVMARTGQRTNDVMRMLTVISSVLLPAVVVGGVMGMNFHPGFFDEPSFFFAVVAIMIALAAGTLVFARRRRWL
jgi:magnesium transporter